MTEPKHCPNCPDQGWYAMPDPQVYYAYNEQGEVVGQQVVDNGQQVQCQWCWETPDSVFNATRTTTLKPSQDPNAAAENK